MDEDLSARDGHRAAAAFSAGCGTGHVAGGGGLQEREGVGGEEESVRFAVEVCRGRDSRSGWWG